MDVFLLSYYKQPLSSCALERQTDTQSTPEYFLWSYYDILQVYRNDEEIPKASPKAIAALRHDACIYALDAMPQDPFDMAVGTNQPLLIVVRFSLHPECLRAMVDFVPLHACRPHESIHEILRTTAHEILKSLSLDGTANQDVTGYILGSLGVEEFVLVLRGASYWRMMTVVDRLRKLTIKSLFKGSPGEWINRLEPTSALGGSLVTNCSVLMGISRRFLNADKAGNPELNAWTLGEAKSWKKLKIIFDVGVQSAGSYAAIHAIFEKFHAGVTSERYVIRPQYGKYNALVEYSPGEDTPAFFYELYSESGRKWLAENGILIFQTHWMGRKEPSSSTTMETPSSSAVTAKVETIQKQYVQLIEQMSELIDTSSLQIVVERILYITYALPYNQHKMLTEQLQYMLDSFEASPEERDELQQNEQRADIWRQRCEQHVDALLTLTNQLEQGSPASQDCFGAHAFYYGSRSKLILSYMTFLEASLRATGQSEKKFLPLLDSSPTIASLVLRHSKRDKCRSDKFTIIVQIPVSDMYKFPRNYPILLHELFHYIPPEDRQERNKLCLKLLVSMMLREKTGPVAVQKIIRKYYFPPKDLQDKAKEDNIREFSRDFIRGFYRGLRDLLFENLLEHFGLELMKTELQVFCDSLHGHFPLISKECGLFICESKEKAAPAKAENDQVKAFQGKSHKFVHDTLWPSLLKYFVKKAEEFAEDTCNRDARLPSESESLRAQMRKAFMPIAMLALEELADIEAIQMQIGIIQKLYKEAKADFAAAVISGLDLKDYYKMLFQYSGAKRGDIRETAFIGRIRLVSRLIARDKVRRGMDQGGWSPELVAECKRAVADARGECGDMPNELNDGHRLEDILDIDIAKGSEDSSEKKWQRMLCAFVEDAFLEYFDATLRAQYSGYVKQSVFAAANECYRDSLKSPQSLVDARLEPLIQTWLLFWLQSYRTSSTERSVNIYE